MIKAKHPFSNNGINQVHLIYGVWEYNISIQWASLNIFHACKTGTCMRKWRTSFLDTPARYRTFPRKSRSGQKHSQLYPHKRTWTPANAYVSAQRRVGTENPPTDTCAVLRIWTSGQQRWPEGSCTGPHNRHNLYNFLFINHFRDSLCLHSKWPNCPFELPGQWVGSEIQTVLSIGMTNLWIRT